VVLKVYSAEPKKSATPSQGIREYISVMASLKFAYILTKKNNVLLRIIAEFL
jgi:hypothetical protein